MTTYSNVAETYAPPVFMDADIWTDSDFKDEPLTRREAYLWVLCYGPIRHSERALGRAWGWTLTRARNFIRTMRARGRFVVEQAVLKAVVLDEAVPDDRHLEGGSWKRLRMRVFVRDGFACVYCGRTHDLHCDHVVARSEGGMDVEDNLVTSCQRCNLSKGNKSLADWRPGH